MTVALIITRTHTHTHNTTHNVDQVTKTPLITTGYWKHRDARRHFVIEAKLIKFDSKSRLQFLAYWNKNEVAYNVAIFRIIHSTSRYSARRRMGAGIKRCRDSSVHPSVCLSIAPLQLRCRPPELCGLRIRPRTDVDPPRSAVAYRLAAR